MDKEVEQPRKMDRIDTWVLTIKEIVSTPPGNTDDRLDLRSALRMFQDEVFGDLEEVCKRYHEVMIAQSNHQLLEEIKEWVEELHKTYYKKWSNIVDPKTLLENCEEHDYSGAMMGIEEVLDYLESKIQNPEGLDSKEGLTSKEGER